MGHLTKIFKGLGTGDDKKANTLPASSIRRPPADPSVDGANKNNNNYVKSLYSGIDMKMRFRRLEEVPILTSGLRQLIKSIHPKGDTITFPCPEAVDRMHLKNNGLPTESTEVNELLRLAQAAET